MLKNNYHLNMMHSDGKACKYIYITNYTLYIFNDLGEKLIKKAKL